MHIAEVLVATNVIIIVVVLLFGLPAMWQGWLAVRRVRAKSLGRAAAHALISLASLALGIAILLPAIARHNHRGCWTQCGVNMWSMSDGLAASCIPPRSHYPTDLSLLSSNDVSPKSFVCPGSLEKRAGQLTNVMEWMDYIYVAGLGPESPREIPVLICPPFHHTDAGVYVAFSDGSAKWLPGLERGEALIADPLVNCPNPPPGLRERITVIVSKRVEEASGGRYKTHKLP